MHPRPLKRYTVDGEKHENTWKAMYLNKRSFWCRSCNRYKISEKPSWKMCCMESCESYTCLECFPVEEKEEGNINLCNYINLFGLTFCIFVLYISYYFIFNFVGYCSTLMESEFMTSIIGCCLFLWLLRVLPALKAIWVQVDVIMDIRQTLTYWNYGRPDGRYAQWAVNYSIKTNTSYVQTVSEGYCITSLVIMFLPPSIVCLPTIVCSCCFSKNKKHGPLAALKKIFGTKNYFEKNRPVVNIALGFY